MEKIILYTDGGSLGNPGPSASGFVICNENGETIKKYSQYLGDNHTNNEAEYQAVILGLKKIKALFGKKKIEKLEIEVRTDSEFISNQMNEKYKILDDKIKNLFIDVWNLKLDFKKVKFVYLPREKNEQAHHMVEEGLKEKNKPQKLF